MYNTPLTKEQAAFAEEYHGLINAFLKCYNYPENDYYDVAALGYIAAVKAYFEKEHLREYAFSTIAYSRMRGYAGRYRKAETRHSQCVISFDEYASLAPVDYETPESICLAA